MTRAAAVAAAQAAFDDGAFLADLASLVAIPSESQAPRGAPALRRYLEDAIRPRLEALGLRCRILPNPAGPHGPVLLAERLEDPALPTVLTYGHGDVTRGQDEQWRAGLTPWRLRREGDRLYGRGVADNKGQHLVNLTALAAVLRLRGALGFNLRVLIETGEETGSPGLRALAEAERAALQADVLIASDGPRLAPERPTLFFGARGGVGFDMTVDLRRGAHHSGNWGGLLADPAQLLAQALADVADARGALRVPEWRPDTLTPSVKAALADVAVATPPGGPVIDAEWGEPGLSASERVFGWSSFAVLAMVCGDPAAPVNAIQPRATARCQLRFPVGVDIDDVIPALRRFLAARGHDRVTVTEADRPHFPATRLDPDHPWAAWAADSVARTTGARPAMLPNLGGSLPNDLFAETLGMPTIWAPHSYAGCSQHAPDEHGLAPILREGLGIMAGLWWDLGEPAATGGPPPGRSAPESRP